MTEHSTEGHDAGPAIKAYLTVFVLLCVFTAVSFVANYFTHEPHKYIMPHMALAIIMSVAVVKALCVGFIFMHLKADWGKVFFIILPVTVMGIMMVIVLLPDITLVWNNKWFLPLEAQPGYPLTLSEPK